MQELDLELESMPCGKYISPIIVIGSEPNDLIPTIYPNFPNNRETALQELQPVKHSEISNFCRHTSLQRDVIQG